MADPAPATSVRDRGSAWFLTAEPLTPGLPTVRLLTSQLLAASSPAWTWRFATCNERASPIRRKLVPREVGTITSVSTGIATVSGLPGAGFEELIEFPGDLQGIVFNLDADEIGVVLLGDYAHLQAGDEVTRSGRVMDIGVGESLLGRVIDPLGRPSMTLAPSLRPTPPHRARSQSDQDRSP